MAFETGLHTESSGAEVSVLEDLFDTSFFVELWIISHCVGW